MVQTLAVSSGYQYLIEVDYLKLLALALIIYAVGYVALRRHTVFVDMPRVRNGRKYEKSALPDTRADLYLQRLKREMEEEKVFCNSDLSLGRLAKRISVSPQSRYGRAKILAFGDRSGYV